MSIDPLSAAGAGTSVPLPSTASTPSPVLGQDDFLKLLVAQLQNQDPTNTQDPSQLVAQLATLTQVQQGAQTNSLLQSMQSAQNGMLQSSLTALVGRTITARTSTVTLAATGSPPPLALHLDGAATQVKIQVTDGTGKVVRTINAGSHPQGDFVVPWDGKNDAGALLAPGPYTISLAATSQTGAAVTGAAQVSGLVTAIRYGTSGPQLQVGGATVAPADVVSVNL